MTTVSTFSKPTRLGTGLLALAGAVVAVALVWAASRVLGIELRVDPGNGQPPGVISLPFAAVLTLLVSALGWGARALLGRLTGRAATIWTALAGGVLLLSFLPLFGVEATGAAKTVLALMHLAVAAVLIPVFGRRGEAAGPGR
ncbi:DUF6069 family protein [Micromonospora sp. PLK6-60]|uniref:DUF6069 family protein n=1 Tax=Micromonospora sp. PLK6-60 TaxID=2873383 RepID=UPI001CA79CD3|nr:DUF6069 family protein [Micromonospora sp. PLK6-60]MBY8874278.1 DUF6069 family protein [Micromonospora sp. PLK6-60]